MEQILDRTEWTSAGTAWVPGPKPAPSPHGAESWLVAQAWASYTSEEHQTWLALYDRQAAILADRASPTFTDGLHALDLRGAGIPDFERLNEKLGALTGWEVVPVAGLVPDAVFVELLAQRRFPAGRFIRDAAHLDYIEAPDIFHDVFGHVPMLTDPAFAAFMQAYGEAGLEAERHGRLDDLARLYWYTVEFGLVESAEGSQVYGAGIASSHGETHHALESPYVERRPFALTDAMRTPYRSDIMQPLYFVIPSIEDLLALAKDGFGL